MSSVNVKEVQSKIAYRMESMNFAGDNNIYVSVAVGTLGEDNVFTPIANSNFNIPDEEVLKILITEEYTGVNLRSAVEIAVEVYLRNIGAIKF